MKQQKSCGVIPYMIKDGEPYFLLVKQTNNVVCFPKGHVEKNETEEETALRECMEETNTKVSIVDGFRQEMGYYMEEYDAYKTVVYFLGKIESNDFAKQESEISDILLCNADETMKLLVYDNIKEIFAKALEFMNR
jgi:8-oxo-dGTP pyrophosphatase MutT (NUDIX family)